MEEAAPPDLCRLWDVLGAEGVGAKLLPPLSARDVLCALGASNRRWRWLVAAAENDAAVWRARCRQRWRLGAPGVVSVRRREADVVPDSWRRAYRALECDAFAWTPESELSEPFPVSYTHLTLPTILLV